MLDSLGTTDKANFLGAVDLYDHFSKQHDLLRESYQTLVEKRITLMKHENRVASEDVLDEHVLALTAFLKELVKFAKPVDGKLTKLFSVGLCRNLASCLFIDLCLDFHQYYYSDPDTAKAANSIREIWSGMLPQISKAQWANNISKNLFDNLRSRLEDIVAEHDRQMNENVNTVLASRNEGVWLELKNQHEPLGIYINFLISPEPECADKPLDGDECFPECARDLETYLKEVGSLVLLSLDLLDFNSFADGKCTIDALKILLFLQQVCVLLELSPVTEHYHCLNPQLVLKEESISRYLHHWGMNRENWNVSAVKNFLVEMVKHNNPVTVSNSEDFRLLAREEITLKSSPCSYLDSAIVKFIVNTVHMCLKTERDEESVLGCVIEVVDKFVVEEGYTDKFSYLRNYFYLSCALLVQSKCEILLFLPQKIKSLRCRRTGDEQDFRNSLSLTYLRIIEYVTAGTITAAVLYKYMEEVKKCHFFSTFEVIFETTKKDFVIDCLKVMSKIITNVKCIRTDVNDLKDNVHHPEGESSSVHTTIYDSKVCTVAMMSSLMLCLFRHEESEEVLSTVLLCLTQCRLCCCLSADEVLPYLDSWAKDFIWNNEGLRKKVLCFVKNVILVDLPGIEINHSEDCRECGSEFIVMTESDEGQEWRVTGKYITDYELVDVDTNKVQLVSGAPKDYLEIKWRQGLESYCSKLQGYKLKLKKIVQQHFYQILVQSKWQIRHLLYQKIYEPALKEILDNWNEEIDKDAIVTRTYVFRALHYIIISDNSKLHYTLSPDYWKKFMDYFKTLKCRESLPLASAMYSYVCSLVMCDCTAGKTRESPLLKGIQDFFFSHFNQQNKLWCQSTQGKNEDLHVKLLGIATVYSTMEEFCTFNNFRSGQLEAKLGGEGVMPVPVRTLLWTLKALCSEYSAGEGDDHVRKILVSECPNLCSSFLRSLMVVISLCNNMNVHIVRVMDELPKLKESINATEPLWAPLLRNMLGVNFTQLPSYMCGLAETSCDNFTQLEAGWEHHVSKLYLQKGKRNQRNECPQFIEFCLRSTKWIHKETKDNCYLGKMSTEESVLETATSFLSSFSGCFINQPKRVIYKETIGPQPTHCQMVAESLRLVRYMCEEEESLHQFVRPYVMDELLADYWDVLGDGEKHQAVVKEVLLLWFFFAKQHLATKHLQQFIKLFMEKHPPVRSMVSILRSLLEQSIDDVTTMAPMEHSVVARGDTEPCGSTMSKAAMLLPMSSQKEKGDWAPLIEQTTVASWIRVDFKRMSEGIREKSSSGPSAMKIHIHSSGVKELYASVYLNLLKNSATSIVSGFFSIDVSALNNETRKMEKVGKSMNTKAFAFNSEEPWHFLMVCYKYSNSNKKIIVEVTSDGIVETLSLKTKKPKDRPISHPFVSVGHLSAENERRMDGVSVSLGNVWVFASDSDGPYRAPILRAFGPSARSFLCPRGDLTVGSFLQKHMGKGMVETVDDSGQEFVMKMGKNLVNELQGNKFMNSLTMQFNCNNPAEFIVYSRPAASEHSYPAGTPEDTVMYGGQWRSERPNQRAYGALLELGGVEHLLVMQARIAELNPFTYDYTIAERTTSSSNPELHELLKSRTFYHTSEEGDGFSVMVKDFTSPKEGATYGYVQAEALDLLLWSVKNSATLNEQFSEGKGYDMMVTLLCSPRMNLGLPVMKTLLSHCFSDLNLKPLQGCGPEDLQLGVLSQSSYCGLITNSLLLSTLLKIWPALLHKRAEVTGSGMQGVVNDVCFGTLNSFELLLRVCVLATSSSIDSSRSYVEINSNFLLNIEAITTVFEGLKLLHTVDVKGYSIHPDLVGVFLKSLLVEEAEHTLTDREKLDKAIKVVVSYLQHCVEAKYSVSYKFNSCVLSLDGLYDSYHSGLLYGNPKSRTKEILHKKMFQKISDTISKTPYDRAPSSLQGLVMIERKYPEMVKKTLHPPNESEDESDEPKEDDEKTESGEVAVSGSEKALKPSDSSASIGEPSDSSASIGEPSDSSESIKDESGELLTSIKGEPSELAASGRCSPPAVNPPEINVQELVDDFTADDAVMLDSDDVNVVTYIGDRVVTILVQFLLRNPAGIEKKDDQFMKILQTALPPSTLCLLANHKSANVRIAVIKILQRVFSLKDGSGSDWSDFQKLYIDALDNIKHQLFNREATDEIIDSAYDLMVSTKQEKYLLPNLFLAVLSRMSPYKDFNSIRKVLCFAHMIANELPSRADQILYMDTLAECLLLSLKSLLGEPAYNAAILAEMTNAYSNFLRISICVKDVQLVKEHIVKVFLLCHFMKLRGVLFSRALSIFSSSVVNVLSLLFAFLNWDNDMEEINLNLLTGSEYSSLMLPLSRDLCLFVLKKAPQGVNPVLKCLEVLTLVKNAFYDLDLFEVSSLVTPLHWFMLDLQLVLLKVWDNTSIKALSRSQGEGPHPKPCDLLQLSLHFSSSMRSLLPQMLYFLSHKNAGMEVKEALVNRLLSDMNFTRNLFLYCFAEESEIGKMIVQNINEMVKSFNHLPLHSACESLLDLAQSLSNLSSSQLGEIATNSDEKFANCLKVSGKDVDAEMRKRAQESLRNAVKDHKSHKETLLVVYNEFLVKHIDLKSLVMNEVKAFEDILCRCVINWRSLASTHSRKSSIWTRNLNTWIELRNNVNSDMTKTVLEPQTRKLNNEKYYKSNEGNSHNLHVGDLSDPFNTVLDALIPSLPHGETRTTIPRYESPYDPDVKFMAKAIEPVASFKSWVIRHGTDFYGNLFMFKENLVFNGTKQVFSCGKADEVDFNSSFSIDKDSILEIRLMKYRFEEVAIEVHLEDGISWFFALETEKDRTSLMNHLKINWSKLSTASDELEEATKNWVDRKMSNFEYLMKLNLFSGRTYNDLCQYPVFPFVLSFHSSDSSTDSLAVLNFDEEKNFRNLEYPLPAQFEDQKKKLEERYKNCDDQNISIKCHYNSFYSNSNIVQNYLIRVPPFPLYHVMLQDGKFDQPDRIFHSVSKTYQISVTENDSREAIPELYYLPELFTNHQKFAFNLREGESVDDVKMPQWCKSPRDFVLMHRAALESSKVTEKLNHWIDLVFGCKQSGERALKSYNTHHPYCYSDIMETNSESKELFKAFASCVGDAPRQLFKDPHPKAKAEPKQKSTFLETRNPMRSLLGMEWGSFAFFTFTKDLGFILTRPKMIRFVNNHNIATNVPGDMFFLVSEGVSVLPSAEELNWNSYHLVRIDPNDGVVRVQMCEPSESSLKVYPIVKMPSHLTVSKFIVEGSYLWVGCENGTVSLYTLQISNDTQQYVCTKVVHLKHHNAAISAISSVKEFGICVTGDSSGICCIWDQFNEALINDPVAVSDGNPITSLLISRTSGEWFSVVTPVNSSDKGILSLHRVNYSKPIHSKELERSVVSLSMTNMKEGTGVNVLAALSAFDITLWSSWDLQFLVRVPMDQENPVTELLWSLDSSEMLVKWRDSTISIYDKNGTLVETKTKVTSLSWK